MTDLLEGTIGIYEIVNTINNKKYIGRSVNLNKRRQDHFKALSNNEHYNHHLQRAYNKYGANAFTFNVLEYCGTLEETIDRERYYIELMGTEYSDIGYNMAYAYILYNKYDSNRKVNKSKRRPPEFIRTNEMNKQISNSLKLYFKDNPESKINLSKKHNTIDEETIYNIKQTLHDDLEISYQEVADRFNVSFNIVKHLCNVNCNEYINEKVNKFLINRKRIKEIRKQKNIMNKFREGFTYQSISEDLELDIRTVIRIVNACKTVHDVRMRENHLKRLKIREASKIAIYFNMTGRNVKKTTKVLGISRSKIYSSLKNY